MTPMGVVPSATYPQPAYVIQPGGQQTRYQKRGGMFIFYWFYHFETVFVFH